MKDYDSPSLDLLMTIYFTPIYLFTSVNDVLKHSQEFSDVYQCPVDSKMNDAEKCIL